MIKLLDILSENNKILIPRRSAEERQKNYAIATQKKIQQYIKQGSKGDLDLRNTPITSLPNDLKVGDNLHLSNTSITSLPNNLKVGGTFYLYNTPITSLPDNLEVGSLSLYNTPITSLPDNLKVGGDLYSKDTPITSLPNDLKVGGNLILHDTPLSKKYTKEQIKQMVPGVKGNVYT